MEAILTTQVINVTPMMAQNWLSQNPNNRSISVGRVTEYARDMEKGDWELNGEPIVIDRNGALKDGQHRLAAVVKSGRTIPMLVVFGVADDVMIFDRGRSRTATDILRIAGYDRERANTSSVGCAKLDMMIRDGNKYTSDIDVARWINVHSDSLAVASRVCAVAKRTNGRVNTKFSPLMLAVVYAFESGVDESDLAHFTEAVRTGIVTDDDYTAAVVFRNDLIAKKIPNYGDARTEWVNMAERAIYDFVNKTPRRRTYVGTKEHMYMEVARCNG